MVDVFEKESLCPVSRTLSNFNSLLKVYVPNCMSTKKCNSFAKETGFLCLEYLSQICAYSSSVKFIATGNFIYILKILRWFYSVILVDKITSYQQEFQKWISLE